MLEVCVFCPPDLTTAQRNCHRRACMYECMTVRQHDHACKIMPKITEQHLTARSDKSVAYVTNNKRLFDILYY